MNDNFNNENNTNESWQSPYASSQNNVNYPQDSNSYEPNYHNHEETSTPIYDAEPVDTFNFNQQNDSYYYNPYNPYNNQQFNNQNPKPKKNKTKVALITILTTLLVIALVAIPVAFYLEKNNILPNSSQNNPGVTIDIKDATEDENALTASEVYKKVENSIVGVMTYSTSENLNATGQGSGIIISKDGYIVTNSHVVGDSKTAKVTVFINSDTSKKEYEARIIGLDPKTDLAVLKIDANDLTPVEFGNSDQLAVGSSVLAIGNPAGVDFANSLTRGIISAINRKLSTSGLVNYIQTDAAINKGNSGGALLDMHGRVIGVNSAKITMETFEGMGFAIPSNTVKKVVDEIIKNGYVTGRACLGIKCEEISQIRAQQLGIPQGVVIREISSHSNLSATDVRTNDIITKIGDTNVTTLADLSAEISKHSINDRVKLTITRLENANSMFHKKASTFTVEVALVEDKG